MKRLLFLCFFLYSTSARAEAFNVSDERVKQVISAVSDDQKRICFNDDFDVIEESCFFVVKGHMYFTPEALTYWMDHPSFPDETPLTLVSDYYVDDPEPVAAHDVYTTFAGKTSGGKSGGNSGTGSGGSGVGHGANNGSGNSISISIGSNNGGGGGGSGDRSCRSCHPGVHPGFGETKKADGGGE